MNILFDRASYSLSSKREYTPEGFLRVPGYVARSGIQQYLASELGLTDRAPDTVVNVYRPPEEVFSTESLASYSAVDATDDHPKELVSAETYRDVAVGVVASGGRQVGDFVEADIIIKDAAVIKRVEAGKVQLSAGYKAEYFPETGVTDDGQKYEIVQRNIRINHVALVDRARAGAQARLHDNNPIPTGGNNMPRVFLDDGASVEVADDATATLITNRINSLKQQVTDAEAKTKKAEEDMEKVKAEKDEMEEKVEEMKKASNDEAIAQRIKGVTSTLEAARKVAGDEFVCDSVNVSDIQRAAMAAKRPNIAWSDKSDIYVQAAFDVACEGIPDAVQTQHKQAAQDGAPKPTGDGQPAVSPRQKYMDSLEESWKGGK